MLRKILRYNMDPESITDITKDVARFVEDSGVNDGIINIFALGSTAGLTMMEFEPNLVKDFWRSMERIAPSDEEYEHHKTWGDDNGRSHIRASVVGQSLTVPIENRELMLGTWQQIVLINFDTRRRERRVVLSILG